MSQQILRSKLNTERPMMKYDKHTLGKRFSKFLSKILWHLNQAPPIYLTVNRLRPSSMNKHVSNSRQQSSIDTSNDRIPYTKRYRRSLTRHRNLTLMSIPEENETELVNCK